MCVCKTSRDNDDDDVIVTGIGDGGAYRTTKHLRFVEILKNIDNVPYYYMIMIYYYNPSSGTIIQESESINYRARNSDRYFALHCLRIIEVALRRIGIFRWTLMSVRIVTLCITCQIV